MNTATRTRIDPLKVALVASACFAIAFVALPLLVMLIDTFRGESGFTIAPWKEILASEVDRRQLLKSLELGAIATAIATFLGAGYAFLTYRTDLPFANVLAPLGVLPLVVPPILLAMSFADFSDMRGLMGCAFLLGLSNAPFVAVLTARGLRSIDGRAYDSALLARGRVRAESFLARSILPEIAAGALFALIFVLSEHGVPEFLTVKGKDWHTYAEGVFARWTRRAVGVDAAALGSPTVAAIPLVLMIGVALWLALRWRGTGSIEGDHRPLPMRRLGLARFPALAAVVAYLVAAVGVPIYVMGAWAAGSTRRDVPPSLERAIDSFRLAVREIGSDLSYTVLIGVGAAAVALMIATPLAVAAARRNSRLDAIAVIPIAVPAVLLGIGMVKVFNRAELGSFYDGPALLVAAYAARFLPFAALTMSAQFRRIPAVIGEAARLAEPSALRRARIIHLPLIASTLWSAACLLFMLCLRELDLAVVLPAGNGTVVRRLSNIVHFGGEEMGGALAILLLLAALLAPFFTILLTGRAMRSLS